MGILDFLVSSAADMAKDKAIDKIENRVIGESPNEKTGCTSSIFRSFISLIWLLVVIAIDILSFVWYPPILGAALEMLVVIITLCIPYLRKKGTLTRWWGWLAFLSAIGLASMAFGLG